MADVDVFVELDPGLDRPPNGAGRGDLLEALELRFGQVSGEGDRDLESTWRGVVVVVDVNG